MGKCDRDAAFLSPALSVIMAWSLTHYQGGGGLAPKYSVAGGEKQGMECRQWGSGALKL